MPILLNFVVEDERRISVNRPCDVYLDICKSGATKSPRYLTIEAFMENQLMENVILCTVIDCRGLLKVFQRTVSLFPNSFEGALSRDWFSDNHSREEGRKL